MRRSGAVAALLALVLAGCGSSSGGSRGATGSTAQYTMPSDSMLPTLKAGATLNVDLDAYAKAPPRIGDIVVFNPPVAAVNPRNGQACGVAVSPGQLCPRPSAQHATEVRFIKRIVAGPGDLISIQDGHAIVNGKPQSESFASPCAGGDGCSFAKPIRVAGGSWFLLGDNRGQSDDSRFWGPLPTAWIIGKVVSHD